MMSTGIRFIYRNQRAALFAFAAAYGFAFTATTETFAKDPAFPAERIEFFEKKVRPLLAAHCFECHSGKSKTLEGGLRLDGRAFVIKGGESGPAVTPGKPAKSLLIEAVRWQSLEMPPKGKLSKKQIAVLEKWVEWNVPWPADENDPTAASTKTHDWDKLRNEHWAFRPIGDPQVPTVKNNTWAQNDLDRFVLAKLEDAPLKPAPPAKARLLIRRLYFDLTGLPPTPAEVDDFVQAPSRTAAISRTIDRLLDSPHYGERWARYWFDVARYSDGFGGFLDSAPLPHAYRYRDWVVNAFNKDLPYNQFVKLQIAGDLIEPFQGAIATGFFALGPTYRSDGGDPDSVAQAKSETLDDRVDTLSRGFMALTVSCARCHEHKFDPIPQLDYYSLAGVFNNTRIQLTPLAPSDVVKTYDDHQQAIKNLDQKIKQLAEKLKKEKRQPTGDENKQRQQWTTDRDQLKKTSPAKYDVTHALADTGTGDMRVAIRGNLRKPGESAPRRLLRILAGKEPHRFSKGSGRLELAEAIADPNNPLTARVFVNRVWMHHFGKAIVRTPSNFGFLGEQPTHPQLLDWLTTRFIKSGWSIKQLHRVILKSATYQMSSRFDEESFRVDGDNHFLWRMNPRRMEVEAWRDSLLAVTGELNRTLGGPATDNLDNRRRTLYFKVSRNGDRFASDLFLRLFDFPLMRASVAKRPTSIVPQQFLFMMNSPFMVKRAKSLAHRLDVEAGDDRQRIDLAYRLLFGRSPTDEEQKLALEFVGEKEASNKGLTRWQQYTQVLLSSNEFMFIR